MKLALCLPWNQPTIPTVFVRTLWASDIPRDAELYVAAAQSAPMARNRMIRRGLDEGIDEFLFFDADQTFPEKIYQYLHGADVDIISGFVPRENYPHPFCVWKKTPDGNVAHFLPAAGGVHEVESVGGGCLLVKRRVFETVPGPWFPMQLDEEETTMLITSDILFCSKVKEYGFKIYAHADVFPGHVKTFYLDKTYAQNCQIEEMTKEMAAKRETQIRSMLAGRRSIYVPA